MRYFLSAMTGQPEREKTIRCGRRGWLSPLRLMLVLILVSTWHLHAQRLYLVGTGSESEPRTQPAPVYFWDLGTGDWHRAGTLPSSFKSAERPRISRVAQGNTIYSAGMADGGLDYLVLNKSMPLQAAANWSRTILPSGIRSVQTEGSFIYFNTPEAVFEIPRHFLYQAGNLYLDPLDILTVAPHPDGFDPDSMVRAASSFWFNNDLSIIRIPDNGLPRIYRPEANLPIVDFAISNKGSIYWTGASGLTILDPTERKPAQSISPVRFLSLAAVNDFVVGLTAAADVPGSRQYIHIFKTTSTPARRRFPIPEAVSIAPGDLSLTSYFGNNWEHFPSMDGPLFSQPFQSFDTPLTGVPLEISIDFLEDWEITQWTWIGPDGFAGSGAREDNNFSIILPAAALPISGEYRLTVAGPDFAATSDPVTVHYESPREVRFLGFRDSGKPGIIELSVFVPESINSPLVQFSKDLDHWQPWNGTTSEGGGNRLVRISFNSSNVPVFFRVIGQAPVSYEQE